MLYWTGLDEGEINPLIKYHEDVNETYVNDCSTAVQVLVQIIQHLSQFLHVLLIGLKQHGLEVDWQTISKKCKRAINGVQIFLSTIATPKKVGTLHKRE